MPKSFRAKFIFHVAANQFIIFCILQHYAVKPFFRFFLKNLSWYFEVPDILFLCLLPKNFSVSFSGFLHRLTFQTPFSQSKIKLNQIN